MVEQPSLFAAPPPPRAWTRRRVAILVTGPNSSAKTTSVRRAVEGLEGVSILSRKSDRPADGSRVVVVHADLALSSGSAPETAAALEEVWRGPWPVLIVEGIDRGARAFAEVERIVSSPTSLERRDRRVFVTIVDPEDMEAHLRERCDLRGKAYREDYWTLDKRRYEGRRRYVNLADRHWPRDARLIPIGADYAEAEILVAEVRLAVEEYL